VYEALWYGSVAFFGLAVPLLLIARVRSNVPWWFVIASATALGWIFANAAVFFQHRAVDEGDRQERLCFDEAIHGNQGGAALNGNETVIENPCGLGDSLRENYKPFAGLLYGPLYLLSCLLPYWLIVRRRAHSAPSGTATNARLND
jgi:hypothetical protein